MSILGDLKISGDRLEFSKAGSCSYKVVHRKKDRFLVKLSREIDGAIYAGIGPIGKWNALAMMDFSLYENKENGLVAMLKSDPLEKCSLWGVYARKQPVRNLKPMTKEFTPPPPGPPSSSPR